jgi:hypothetical protein
MGRVLPKLDAVLLCLDGELATHSVLHVADGGVEVVCGESAHRGEGCQRSPVGGDELVRAWKVSGSRSKCHRSFPKTSR